ncbi:hypothetical protein Tco_0948247 [Tanacetum coccineum]|uniref:Uncharacterized protein n=1 Tax=Tanacetum coccineum TaxID=301880 RepID=A0ABQ5AH83_9ASTR
MSRTIWHNLKCLARAKSDLDDMNVDSNDTLELVADALPTIGLAEAPHSHNHVKSPQTQDNSTKDDPYDRGSKLDPEGVAKGRDATINKLNEDADPNEGFPDNGNTAGDKIGKELPHFAPKANHPLEKVNHSRCKEYKKYKAKRDSLVLEKERLENELLQILAASKQDKESFAKDCTLTPGLIWYHRSGGGYELTREYALTKDCTFTLGYIWYHHSGGGYELIREYALTKDCTFTPGYIWYYYSGGGHELTRQSALTKDCTFTPGYIWYYHFEGGHELTRESTLTKDCTLTPGLGVQALHMLCPFVMYHGLYSFKLLKFLTQECSYGPLSPLLKGSGASGDGRTTPKKEACSSHSFNQKDGSACIVLDECITEHTHEVEAMGCDSKLPLGNITRLRMEFIED